MKDEIEAFKMEPRLLFVFWPEQLEYVANWANLEKADMGEWSLSLFTGSHLTGNRKGGKAAASEIGGWRVRKHFQGESK